jgi:hypothetical protein
MRREGNEEKEKNAKGRRHRGGMNEGKKDKTKEGDKGRKD